MNKQCKNIANNIMVKLKAKGFYNLISIRKKLAIAKILDA